MRGGGASSVLRLVSCTARPRTVPRPALAGPEVLRPASSTMEFHAPQASQRPDHLEVMLPQSLHEKEGFLAMRPCDETVPRRQTKLALFCGVGQCDDRIFRCLRRDF